MAAFFRYVKNLSGGSSSPPKAESTEIQGDSDIQFTSNPRIEATMSPNHEVSGPRI